ncbi:voltage-dependent L-type calcium channel subunit beta-1-like [Caloenas nicobarica]|uniref:voltage-dependent L-type calcium channel subunit beta-1-like n=1 Tax=Caloenas nicobarica TaxID=187106 RepID=UPI0032B78C7F
MSEQCHTGRPGWAGAHVPPPPSPQLTHPPTNPPICLSVCPSLHGVVASPNQGPYPVPGEHGRLRQGLAEGGGHGQGPPVPPAPRSLSRQDTFDSEPPGGRDDSCCMDIEMDPGDEEPPRPPPNHQHPPSAWDEDESRGLRGRAKGQDRYGPPTPPEALEQGDAGGWGQDVYIR